MTEINSPHRSNTGSFGTFWAILGMMIFAVILSAVFFQKQSLRLDESQSLWQTSHSSLEILHTVAQDVHVPLYHLLLHVWQFFFGNDVSTARILSLIFFLMSIPAIYFLGKRSYNRNIGLFTAALLTISPFMNWYGNEIRMYSMFVLIAILNQYFFIGIYKEESEGEWAGFIVTAIFGIYTHYFFFLILATDAMFYFFNRHLFSSGSLRKFISVAVWLVVLFLPWIFYVIFLGGIGNSEPTLSAPNSINLFNTFSQFVFGFQTDHLNTVLVSLWPLTVLLGFLALRRNRRVNPETLYFLLGFLLPNIIAFVVSFILKPIYLTRYLIFTLPMMYLLLCWLFSTYPRKLAFVCRAALVFAMLATLTIEALSASTPAKENYREAVAYIEEKSTPADVVVVSVPFTIYPVLYYYHGPSKLATIPLWDQDKIGGIPAFSESDLPAQVETIKGNHQNLWLLLSYNQGYEEKLRIYFDTHFQRLDAQQFSPGISLYEYQLRYD